MNDFTSPRRGFTLWQLALVLAVLGILAAVLFPVFFRQREIGSNRSSCQSNLKQIMLGVKQYQQDCDEKYPQIASSPPSVGWADVLQPYIKSTQVFQCSREETAGQIAPAQLQYTDYWFNARLAGVSDEKLDDMAQTITLGDGNDGYDSTDATYHLFALPQRWLGDSKSPLYRHPHENVGGANFAFADGHAKWIQAEEWKSGLETASGYSFLPKIAAKPTN